MRLSTLSTPRAASVDPQHPARALALVMALLVPGAALAGTTAPASCVAHIEGAEMVLFVDATQPAAATADPQPAPEASTDAADPADIVAEDTTATPDPADTPQTSDAAPDSAAAPRPLPDLFALPDCAPETVLRHFTPDLAEADRAAFCLVRDETDDGTATYAGFSEGPRDAALGCTATTSRFCERVNASRDTALKIAGLSEDASPLDTATATVDGVRSLRERAGATILTGTGGAVASTLSNLGATALAAATAPAAIAAGVVSVVAVGGAVYVCR